MSVLKAFNVIKSFSTFNDATNFLNQFPNFGSDLKLPEHLTTKNFITAMLMMVFSSDILSTSTQDLIMKNACSKLVNGILQSENENILKQRSLLFLVMLQFWEKKDKKSLVSHLIDSHKHVKKMSVQLIQDMDILSSVKQETIAELDDYTKKIENCVSNLDVTRYEELFNDTQVKQFAQGYRNNYIIFWKRMNTYVEQRDFKQIIGILNGTLENFSKIGMPTIRFEKLDNENIMKLVSFIERNYPIENNVDWKKELEKMNNEDSLLYLLEYIVDVSSLIECKTYMSVQKLL